MLTTKLVVVGTAVLLSADLLIADVTKPVTLPETIAAPPVETVQPGRTMDWPDTAPPASHLGPYLPSPAQSGKHLGNGLILLEDGKLVDESGRLLARWHGPDGDGWGNGGGGDNMLRDDTCIYWSDPAQMSSPGITNTYIGPTLFDSQGDAWVIFVESNDDLMLRRSNGHDGTWNDAESLFPSGAGLLTPMGVIDSNDVITLFMRGSDYYVLDQRYEPGVGWSSATWRLAVWTIGHIGIAAAGDSKDVLVTFEVNNTGNMWYARYDPSTWSGAFTFEIMDTVAPEGMYPCYATLVQNEAGGETYLIYQESFGGVPVGLYSQRYDWSAATWGAPEMLPGTESLTTDDGGTAIYCDEYFPACVDSNGEVTVFWQSESDGQYGIHASRTEGGVWQAPHELLGPGPFVAELMYFADTAVSDDGDVFGVMTRYEDDGVHFYAFRHRAGIGWDPTYNPHTFPCPITASSRVAAYGDGKAVATFHATQNDTVQLTSVLYDGTEWLPEFLNIPDEYCSYMQDITAHEGEPLLIAQMRDLIGPEYGIRASWMRSGLPGDLDGDGEVGQADLGILLSSYELNAGGDCDGDGDTDQADLGILLGNYGQTCP